MYPTPTTFRGLLTNLREGQVETTLTALGTESLPPGDVFLAVLYSSLNYKDALAVTGRGKIIRNYPMVPGIDLVATVEETESAQFNVGDMVLLTGFGMGETRWGGYAQKATSASEWLVPLPEHFTPQQAMAIGTAGLTAMQCLMELEAHGICPGDEVVVTGASGGVGSLAVLLLSTYGYRVVASTGRMELTDYLTSLGAAEVIERSVLSTPSDKPLQNGRWKGAVDTVGGTTLANLLSTSAYHACVTACGLASDSNLPTTVFPFILRGVRLIGVDTAQCSMERRTEAWRRLSEICPISQLDTIMTQIPLHEVPTKSLELLEGKVRGRLVVDVNA